MKTRSLHRLLPAALGLLLVLPSLGVAAPAADHVLFSDPLNGSSVGQVTGGKFLPGGGWQPIDKFDRIQIELPVAARDGSVFEVEIRNLDVPKQRDDGENFLLGLREHPNLSGGGANVPHADYFMIFAGTKYPQFKLKYHTHGFSHQEDVYAPIATFDPTHTYKLRVEWAAGRLAVSFDGKVFYEQRTPDSDRFDRVKFIQLGYLKGTNENRSFSALRNGPIYSNVRITTAVAPAPRAPRDLIVPQHTPAAQLRWAPPANPAGLAHYLVFRDAQEIARVTGKTAYTDTPPHEAAFAYNVAAVYADGTRAFAAEPALVTRVERSLDAARGTAKIDGRLDEAGWKLSRRAARRLHGRPDNDVTFGALWDDTHLYLAAKVMDKSLVRDSVHPTDDDAVEFLIDGDNNGEAGKWDARVFDAHDCQILVRWGDDAVFARRGPVKGPLQQTPAAEAAAWPRAMAAIPGGYVVEVAIPWKTLGVAPATGRKVGFDVRVHDDDDGGAADAASGWLSESQTATFTLAYGDIVLK